MKNYDVGNETGNDSRCVGVLRCRWKGVVCLAGILISLVVGSFGVVTYGASTAEIDGSESKPIQSMFDKCRKVFCRYQTYPIENHLKEKEAYQNYNNTKLS